MRQQARRILLLLLLPVAAVVAATAAYVGWEKYSVHQLIAHHSLPDPPPAPPESRTPDHLRVLFIGNSFTNFDGGQALILTRLAQSAHEAHPPIAEQVTINGGSLKMQWLNKVAARRIAEGHWDYVVLQEFSTGPIQNLEDMREYARRFDQEIRKVGARTVFYMTWARKDEPENTAVLADGYERVARELGAEVVPVGLAWENAIRQRPGLNLFAIDGKHPNARGVYLNGCTFYRFFYGHMPRGLAQEIANERRSFLKVDDAEAAYLQGIADQTVTAFARYQPATAPVISGDPPVGGVP